MEDDVHNAAAFYASRQGQIAARLLCDSLQTFWPATMRGSLLGLGYTRPFLGVWNDNERLIDAQFGSIRSDNDHVYRGSNARTCVVDPARLPFDDVTFDRVLLVHGLDMSQEPNELLRGIWKILKDDGRLLVVVPNRTGIWAHKEDTPFGQGTPFSARQIQKRLADGLFRVERKRAALLSPPINFKPVLKTAHLVEKVGLPFAAQFSGVHLIEAVKDVYAALPSRANGAWTPLQRQIGGIG